jgi:putative ABC transport system permease protein
MRELLTDLRYGVRLLWKNPGVTMVAVLALALGIGANTAIFSAVNAVLLRPLPFPEPDRLVSIRIDHDQRNIHNAHAAYPDIAEWRQQCRSFETLAANSADSVNLTVRGEPERASVWKVNASLLPMLGLNLAVGRAFLPEDDPPGAGRVAILSHSLWERRFGADPKVVGRTVAIDGDPYVVVGILATDFKLDSAAADLYTPIAQSGARGAGDRWAYGAYGRLKRGVTIQQAQAELDTVQQRIEKQYPRQITGWRAHVWGLREFMVRDVRLSLMVLLGAVGLVLLTACVNVANLLLALAGARQREMAIRAAMGARRARVVRQLLTESCLLGLAGGAFGLLLAYWGVMALSTLAGEAFPLLKQARVDLPVLGFTMLISLGTGLVFGIAPAVSVSRGRVFETLKEGNVSSPESRGRNRLRALLVISEVAAALLLMIGASLMIRSLVNLLGVNPGFNPAGVLTASINLPAAKYPKREQQTAFYRQLDARLQAMPGVTAAGMVSVLPLTGSNQGIGLLIEGRPVSGPADVPILYFRIVNERYFQAMQIPLRRGRMFTGQDLQVAPKVLIVNETMARRYWPNQDPIGKRVGNGARDGWMPVVGVVGDVRHMSLAQEPDAEIYMPLAQNPQSAMKLAVRTSSDPLRFAPALSRAVLELDRDQPISRVASMEQNLADSLATKRVSTLLLGIFATVALLLAAIGIYGVISFSVTRRRHEIGVRMALGARAGDVLWRVVAQGTLLAAMGVLLGMGASLVLTRVIGSLLYGVQATDPLVFAVVPLLLLAVAAVASFVPARRAARVDPMVALRHE